MINTLVTIIATAVMVDAVELRYRTYQANKALKQPKNQREEPVIESWREYLEIDPVFKKHHIKTIKPLTKLRKDKAK